MKKPHEKKLVIPWLKISGVFAAGCGLFIADQIRRVHTKINNSVAIDVLKHDRYQPTYIYIEDPFFQEQIAEWDILRQERLKLTRLHKWLYDKIEESFLFRNWWKFRQNLAWRFLTIAKGDNQVNRLRAVRSLALLGNLSDSDYQQLAQACDLRTAVGLARSTGNIEFLLDPPYFKLKPNRQAILRHLHDFLLALDSEAKHPCLQYFISKVFSDISETDVKTFDDDLGIKVTHSEQIPMCLEALLHHSWIGSNAKYIVTLGGLPLLTEIYKYLQQEDPHNIDSLIMLSRLMSNITTFEECKEAFYKSGWIKLLAILSQHKDIRISAPAQRALHNYDEDDTSAGEGIKLHRKVYQLYPRQRMKGSPKIDVIFIHGLLGGVFITWRQRDTGNCGHKSPLELLGITSSDEDKVFAYQTNKPNELSSEYIVDISDLTDWEHLEKGFELVLSDIPVDANWRASGPFYSSDLSHSCDFTKPTKCWPSDWLPSDCPEARILGINYETNISLWAPMCPIVSDSRNLTDRSSYISHVLTKAGVGKRPIVWVAHSMGGLLVKDMLVQSMSNSDPEKRSLFDQTKAIIFYSTPHKGSRLAALNATSQMIIWPSVEVQELRENSPALIELHEKFLESLNRHPIKIVSFAERESTYITSLKFEVRFVDNVSADPDVGEIYGIPLDHLCICKPACKQSFIYQKVLKVIKEVVNEAF